MNDIFACYDQLFGSNSTQLPSDVSNIQQLLDHEALYFGGQSVANDVASPVHGQTIQHNSNIHANIPFVQIHTTDVQPQQQNYGNVFRRAINQNQGAVIKSEPIKSEGADNGKATPTPPVRNTSCNSSEQRIAPESRNQNLVNNNENVLSEEADSVTVDAAPALNVQTFHSLNVYRCNECSFLCLDEISLENHVLNEHSQKNYGVQKPPNGKQRIQCPGCSNEFFAFKSFEMHLFEDHFVSLSDVRKILGALQNTEKVLNSDANNKAHSPQSSQKHQRKSRIYLKNVECLREPHLEPMDINGPGHVHTNESGFFGSMSSNFDNEQIVRNDNELSDLLSCGQINVFDDHEQTVSSTTSNSCSLNASNQQPISSSSSSLALTNQSLVVEKPKQKISIKSVDVLREPALLERAMNELQCNEIAVSVENSVAVSNDQQKEQHHQYSAFNVYEMPATNVLQNCNDENVSFGNSCAANYQLSESNSFTPTDNHIASAATSAAEKPRRPKIYIKNVDILKQPMMNLVDFESQVQPLLPLPLPHPPPLPAVLPQHNPPLTPLALTDSNSGLALGGFNFLNTEFLNNSACNASAANIVDLHEQCEIGHIDKEDVGFQQMQTSNLLYEMPPAPIAASNVNNNNNNAINNSNDDELTLMNNVDEVFANYTNNGNANGPSSYLAYPPVIDCDGLQNACTISSSTTPFATDSVASSANNAQNDNVNIAVDVAMAPQKRTESQPPPIHHHHQQQQQQQKQKIFIKNVDILKQPPQVQVQRERGTLHLRTVDELNLMNRNEVEGLIAPNLEHSNAATTSLETANESENENQSGDFVAITNQQNNRSHNRNSDDALYINDDHENLKLHDYASQLVNNCWTTDDYDLGNDIDCIITDAMPESIAMLPPVPLTPQAPTAVNDLDTPQSPLISIRDIDELTLRRSQNSGRQQPAVSPEIKETYTEMELEKIEAANNNNNNNNNNCNKDDDGEATTLNFHICIESPPPLAPLATLSTARAAISDGATLQVDNEMESKTALPPLVKTNSLPSKANSAIDEACHENGNINKQKRGRIYVANNLVQTSSISTTNSNAKESTTINTQTKNSKNPSVSIMGGTSVQGRPFGSNRTLNDTKLNKLKPQPDTVVKCSVRNCAFRFKKPETLAYHQRCHDSTKPNSWQAKVCPECNQKDFSNWNTLHTHLWRTHKVDMELYSCTLCQFKTPIYSRLVNTHTKIHSEERNYKCELCGKGFKNTKQLKNHRRWHRVASKAATVTNLTAAATTGTGTTKEATPPATNDDLLQDPNVQSAAKSNSAATQSNVEISLELHRCDDCGSLFSHSKTLREHNCKKNDHHQLTCSICGHAASSKSAFKLHKFTHENTKRLKCAHCTYSTSDHNAFRRHKMTHTRDETNMYECSNCNYKSIQSSAFQKHVLAKHPEDASDVIHKCKICTYSTVSRGLFALHQIKHSKVY